MDEITPWTANKNKTPCEMFYIAATHKLACRCGSVCCLSYFLVTGGIWLISSSFTRSHEQCHCLSFSHLLKLVQPLYAEYTKCYWMLLCFRPKPPTSLHYIMFQTVNYYRVANLVKWLAWDDQSETRVRTWFMCLWRRLAAWGVIQKRDLSALNTVGSRLSLSHL